MKSVVSLCAALLATSAYGAATAPYIESFDVRVNSIDVIVTDARGNRVTGLQQGDFEVFENGARQPVSNFSEYRAEQGQATATAPSSVSRKFIFVIDDMSLHPEVRKQLKASINDLVASSLREGDEAMIVTPESHERVLLPFSSDRAVLLAALDNAIDANDFRAVSPLNLERHQMEMNASGVFRGHAGTPTIYAAGNRIQTTIGHLQSIVSAMAEVPGKKIMILVTEWLPAVGGWNGSAIERINSSDRWSSRRSDLRPELNNIAQTASSNGIAIYAFQPATVSGLALGGPDAGNQDNAVIPSFQRVTSNTETTMEILADRTGATWSHEASKLFDRLQEDLSTYYSIGYKPTSTTANKVRRIEVRVKGRPELSVRTRRDVVQKSLTAEMNERVVGHLVYPRDVDELGVVTTIGALRADRGTFVVPVTVEVPISSLTLIPEGDRYKGSFSVHYAAAGFGEFSSGVERQQVVDIPASKIAAARSHSWTYTSDLRVLPGKTDIAVGVVDPISRLTTFKTIQVNAH